MEQPKKRMKLSENEESLYNQLFDEISLKANSLSSANSHLSPSYLYIINRVKVCNKTNTVELNISNVSEKDAKPNEFFCYLQDSW